MRKIILFFLFIFFAACGGSEVSDTGETRFVTDVWGREVEIPVRVESIIALGSGAPRLAAYLDVMDMLVGSEQYIENGIMVLRDYNPVHFDLLSSLPFVGAGGGSGNNNGFPEEILQVAPDVILAGFDFEPAEELQGQTGIPVVSVRHFTGLADESFFSAMRVFAEVVGAEERAEFIFDYINSMKADLYNRTTGIPDDEKLRAYAGAVTWNGRRGIAGTYSVFGIFDAINAVNVAYTSGISGFFEADLESILIWDPDVIFLDPGNIDLVNEEYRVNATFFQSLRAIQNGRVYTLPSFNNAGTNITYAFMNAYFAGTVLFSEEFSDIDIAEKSAEILTTFLGKNTFEFMAEAGLFFGTLAVGE
ncbi:MAG: ABC transporter substrate-binding protein [Defluviitaleaceae bacterium]|nr:ABC transporter substrate-binding protein [Defluviitaleaceae bacterium]